jgi:hypothetical protein
MTVAICCVYLWFNWYTWERSSKDREVYLQRLAVSAAVMVYLFRCGNAQASFVGLLSEWMLLGETVFFLSAVNSRHPILYSERKAT